MEFLKGTDLIQYTSKQNLLPINKVLDLTKRIATGLAYAHSNDVVHRDIKPANIMWDPATDSMKITDFGVARITNASRTRTGAILGTPPYMSPEQLAGQKVSGQSDLFSLGVMLFHLVTGELPFKGEPMATLVYQITNQQHPAPTSINPNVPRCVCTIINRAMEKDLEKRYKTGMQMATDIVKCQKIIAAELKGRR
jgi:serine/threonine-protein kinase